MYQNYHWKRKSMRNEMSVGMLKNPLCNQYVAPEGYHFVHNGQNLGRIVWINDNKVDGYTVEKDGD